MEPLLFALLPFLLVPAATLIVHPDEHALVRRSAPLLLGLFLLITLALLSITLWLKLSLTLLLALGLWRFPVLEVSRWLLGPLALLVPLSRFAPWALAVLLLASIATGALLTTTFKRRTPWHARVLLALRWLALPLIGTAMVVRLVLL